MSTYTDQYDDDPVAGAPAAQGDGPASNGDFAWRRKQEQATKQAQAERDQARRELALIKAGIDPEKGGVNALFAKAYDGPPDLESIRAAATEYGLLAAPAPTAEQQQAQVEQVQALEAQQRVSAAAGSGLAAPNAQEQQTHALDEAYKAGGIDGLTNAMQAMGIPQQTL